MRKEQTRVRFKYTDSPEIRKKVGDLESDPGQLKRIYPVSDNLSLDAILECRRVWIKYIRKNLPRLKGFPIETKKMSLERWGFDSLQLVFEALMDENCVDIEKQLPSSHD